MNTRAYIETKSCLVPHEEEKGSPGVINFDCVVARPYQDDLNRQNGPSPSLGERGSSISPDRSRRDMDSCTTKATNA